MANKLTKEKLNLLIEQVLNEKTNYPFDADSEYFKPFGFVYLVNISPKRVSLAPSGFFPVSYFPKSTSLVEIRFFP